ncbi:MFS transporter [Merismopedia glauca CCAP 1448/3]|uniref:MFS transporter n=2 Tax=Merismopedia TaxID=53402 RepID=A0A2T1BYK7_9CYAN|nr:MFS transporter [Merismopedia glauca CCAP 1448/3]
MLALLLLGFSSGLPLFLTSRTLQVWMTEEKVDLGVIGWFSLVALPYSLKFLWSPVLDRFAPPFLGRRKGWLFLTQIALLIAIAAIGFQKPAQDVRVLTLLAATALIITFLSASQDIVGDAYRTDVLKPQEREFGASVWVYGYRMALLVTSFLALVLAQYLPWRTVYLLMAGLMGIGIVTTLWTKEPEYSQHIHSAPPTAKDILFLGLGIGLIGGLFWGAATGYIALTTLPWIIGGLLLLWLVASLLLGKNRRNSVDSTDIPQTLQDAVYLPFQEFFGRRGALMGSLVLVFILLYKLGDALVGNMANPFLIAAGFSKAEIGTIQGGMGFIATTVGVFTGGLIMTKIGMYRSLWVFGVLQLISNFGYYLLAISGKNSSLLVVAINIENFCAGLVAVVTVAYIMSLCDRRFTTTQFALFSSLLAISRDVLAGPAGDLAKATGWSNFFLLTMVFALPGLFLLPLVAPWNGVPPDLDQELIQSNL